MFKKIAQCLCFTLFLGLLTACGPEGSLRLSKDESKLNSDTKNITKTPTENQNTSAENKIGNPVALPPNFDSGPPELGQSEVQFMPNGLPALQPMKGINIDELFSEKIKNSDDRFERLENAVLEMRKEFESVKPSIVRLAAVEADIQSLVKEMDVMLQETPSMQNDFLSSETKNEPSLQVEQLNPLPVPPAEQKLDENQDDVKAQQSSQATDTQSPVAGEEQLIASKNKEPPDINKATQPPQALENIQNTPTVDAKKKEEVEHILKLPPSYNKEQKAQEPAYDGIIAKNLRVGEHNDKIRIVLDTNQKTPFSVDIDNDEKLIIVELPEARWVGSQEQKFPDSALLESYSVEPINDGRGSMIVITMSRETDIIKQSSLMPDQNPNHRIYFDLKL